MSATATRSRSGAKSNGNGDTPEAQYKQFLDARIQELQGAQEELTRLQSIKAAMEGRPTGAATARRTAHRRQGRLAEFVKLAHERPGITISEAAKEMNVANNYLYRVTAKGVSEGLLRKENSNFYAVEATSEPADAA